MNATHPRATFRVVAACVGLLVGLAPAVREAGPVPLGAELHPSGSGFAGAKWGDATADKVAKDVYGRNAAQQDPGSLFTVERAIGARSVWTKRDQQGRNVTGQGVGVALLDSGVTRVPGLDGVGKVTYGPDLSVEGNGVLADQDHYGHGTFLAGIIAGRSVTNRSSDLPGAPADIRLGVAPDADVVSIKAATSDGGTDVSQVIAGLDWVAEHPVMPNGTRIRVVNLSYGTTSTQSYTVDPLAAAAENAWKHGIVVVTSAGNDGNTAPVTDPAVDPYVLTVAAATSNERVDGWKTATVAAFSAGGTGARHPDLAAPGASIVSSRVPGSTIDVANPAGLVSGDTSGQLFRGSGTSQAAAVVSGAATLLLQAFPALTPDQVKYALVSTADRMAPGTDATLAGAGLVDVGKAYDTASHLVATDKNAALLKTAAAQSFPAATGTGSIDQARGDSVLLDPDGDQITGEVDAQGNPWDATAWAQASSSLSTWSDGSWLGHTWTGNGWQSDPSGMSTVRWGSAVWTSALWSDADWNVEPWGSARWGSARWGSARWGSARWGSARWGAACWGDDDS